MNSHLQFRQRSDLNSVAAMISVFPVIVGSTVVVGWRFNIALLKSVVPVGMSMQIKSARCFNCRQRADRLALLLMHFMALIGLIAMIGYASGTEFVHVSKEISLLAWHIAVPLIVASVGVLSTLQIEGSLGGLVADCIGSIRASIFLPIAIDLHLLIIGLRGNRAAPVSARTHHSRFEFPLLMEPTRLSYRKALVIGSSAKFVRNNMRRFAKWIIPALTLALSTASGAAPPAGNEALILAVHPYLPAREIIKRFTPLADYLARESGRPVNVRIGRSYAEHIEAIGTDSVDIAYLGPVSYVKMVRQYGRKPLLARQEVGGQPYLRGVIIVRTDSPLRALADLKGKRFAFGDPESTMSYVVPLHMLEHAGVPKRALAHYQFLGTHENVALAVLSGDYDAGAVKSEVFDAFAPKGIRALATTPNVADHIFVANGKLPVDLVNVLRRAFLQLNALPVEVPEGKAIMAAIHDNMSALVPAMDSDYDSLRTIMGYGASGKR